MSVMAVYCARCGGWIECHADPTHLVALDGKRIAAKNGDAVQSIEAEWTEWSANLGNACHQASKPLIERTCGSMT